MYFTRNALRKGAYFFLKKAQQYVLLKPGMVHNRIHKKLNVYGERVLLFYYPATTPCR